MFPAARLGSHSGLFMSELRLARSSRGELPQMQGCLQFFEWSLRDTHVGVTDAFKRYRTNRSIRRTFERLGVSDIEAWSNGIETWCVQLLNFR